MAFEQHYIDTTRMTRLAPPGTSRFLGTTEWAATAVPPNPCGTSRTEGEQGYPSLPRRGSHQCPERRVVGQLRERRELRHARITPLSDGQVDRTDE